MDRPQLFFAAGQKDPPAGFFRQRPQKPFAFDRNAGDAADPDYVDGGLRGLDRLEHLVDVAVAVFVVTVGDQDDGAAAFDPIHLPGELRKAVEDGGAAAR